MGISSALRTAPAIVLVAALTAAPVVRANGPPDPNSLVKAELVAERTSLTPGSTLWVDLHLAIKPGWHVYWRNPGDSGLPTTIEWELAARVSRPVPFSWPVPEHFVQGGIGNYGYAGSADLLVPISVANEVAAGGICRPFGRGVLARLRRDLHTRQRQPFTELAYHRRARRL